MKNNIQAPFNSSIQASQYELFCEDGYEFVDNKGDTIIVGLDRDDDVSCPWKPHTIEINVNGDMVYHYSSST